MSKASVVRVLTAALLIGLSVLAVLTIDPRLGLDLRGGTSITLQTSDGPGVEANAASTDRTIEVLRRRVDGLGVAEPTIARVGDTRVLVELPGVSDTAGAVAAIGQTAQLTVHPVLDIGDPAAVPAEPDASVDTAAELTLLDEDLQPVRLGPSVITGEGIGDSIGRVSDLGAGNEVVINFRGDGSGQWGALTAEAACSPPGAPTRRVAFVLDGEVISSPPVADQVTCGVGIVGGSTVITGGFTLDEAQDLAALVEGGALPLPVEILSTSSITATLGDEAIEASVLAGVIGIGLTAIFLVIVYRLLGLLAAVALASYGLLSYAALLVIGATLTLPGLAGLLLSAGLAIDANVLVFERAREERAGGTRLRGSLRTAYAKALSAIADSAITTIIAAVLLFILASGPVRGFGITLIVGTVASLVSALLVTRAFTDVASGAWLERRAGLSGISTPGRVRTWLMRKNPDLMRHRRRWLALSGVLLVLATSGIVFRGLNFGVEFTGGRLAEFTTAQTVDVGEARDAVAAAGFPDAVVQRTGQDDISIRTPQITDAEANTLQEAIAGLGGQTERFRDEVVGPTLGNELRDKALLALGIALLAQLAYLAVRFRWTFSSGTVLAMLHDVLIVIGAFAWLGKPIDGVFLAAVLTIIGVSVNDSIVTMDRIRELWTGDRTSPLPAVANAAILQTAPRTVNTGIGAMFILATLFLLGGSSLTDFGLALLLGLIIGTYSSAFTATPLLLEFETRSQKPPPMPKVVVPQTGPGARARANSGAVV